MPSSAKLSRSGTVLLAFAGLLALSIAWCGPARGEPPRRPPLPALPEPEAEPEEAPLSPHVSAMRLDEIPLDAAIPEGPAPAAGVALPRNWFAHVRQRTKLAPEESDLYYRVLAHARDTNYAAQKKAAARFLEERKKLWKKTDPRHRFSLFADVFLHPQDFVGQPVTLKGHILTNVSTTAEDNRFGIDRQYEAWLYDNDAGHNPAVVVYLDKPEGLPEGKALVDQELVDGIVMTGYFFKIHVYDARDGFRAAPLFLAQKIEWYPRGERDRSGKGLGYWYCGLGAAAVMIALLFWSIHRREMRRLDALRHRTDVKIDPARLERMNESSGAGEVPPIAPPPCGQ
jgi:hypothetical protein